MRKRLRKKLRRRHWFNYRLSPLQAAEKVVLDKYGFRSMAKLQAASIAGKLRVPAAVVASSASLADEEQWVKELAGTTIAIDIDREILADLAKLDKG